MNELIVLRAGDYPGRGVLYPAEAGVPGTAVTIVSRVRLVQPSPIFCGESSILSADQQARDLNDLMQALGARGSHHEHR